jgi:hypothetical protein
MVVMPPQHAVMAPAVVMAPLPALVSAAIPPGVTMHIAAHVAMVPGHAAIGAAHVAHPRIVLHLWHVCVTRVLSAGCGRDKATCAQSRQQQSVTKLHNQAPFGIFPRRRESGTRNDRRRVSSCQTPRARASCCEQAIRIFGASVGNRMTFAASCPRIWLVPTAPRVLYS